MKYNKIVLFCLFSAFCAQACSIGDYEVTIQRNYAGNPGEMIQLYAAESTNLRNSFAFRDESLAAQVAMMTYKVCLDANKDYSLELSSMNFTAWAKDSYVTLMYNKIILVNSRVYADDKGKKNIIFNLSSLVDSSANWKYATNVDAVSWKESKIEEWGEEYKNKEIKNAGSSVYFRKDITVDDSFTLLQLAVQSQSGFIVYVNGIKVHTYLLPESSKINEKTPSQSLEDVPTYKHIVVPKELLASSVSLTTLKIAIELHTTADYPELLSSFDALTYITKSKDSMDTLSMLASRRLQDIPTYAMSVFLDNEFIDFPVLLSLTISNCVLSSDLPTGLKLSECILSGTPKEVITTEYTLSYTNDEDGSSSNTYTFNLQIFCNPTNCAHIRVNRITGYDASYEKVIIKSEDGNIITTLVQGEYLDQNYDYYGPVGTWSFELIEKNNSFWNEESLMIVYVIDDLSSTYILVSKIRAMYKSPEIYYVNTNYSMLMKSEWKYNSYDSLPTEWYGSSIDDSTWSTANGATAITPTATNQYFVFRKTINTPSITSQKYFVLSYKSLSNTKIYINNHELAAHGFKDGYLDSTDASTIIEQTATGPLSLFDNQNTITISVLLYDKQHIIDISFDASLLMVADNNLPVYGDYGITVSNYFKVFYIDCVVDLDLSVNSYLSIYGLSDNTNPILSISIKDGYKYINRYCITYVSDQYLDAPQSWTVESIDINGNRHEHSVISDAFNSHSSQRRCFFLSDVTTGINKLEFTLTNNVNNKVSNDYSISEIELFVDDITSDTLPSLSTSSNPYYAYDNTTISILFTNSEYYHDFTIIPSLPDEITFNTNTGSIYGIIHGENGDNIYTIHATSVIGTSYEYTLTISIQSCQFPNNFVNIQLEYEQEAAYKMIIENYVTYQQVKEIYHIYERSSEDYNVCLSPSIYSFSMSIVYGESSSVSHIYVNNKYYSEFDHNKNVYLSFTQYVDASKMAIIYSYDNIAPPKHWNTLLFNDNVWSTVPSVSSLPDVPEDSITQYYRMHYTIEELISLEYQLDITVSTYAGMIIYINGYEVRRVNMNNGDNVEYNTLATTEYSEYKPYRTVVTVFIDQRIRIIGDNIIAIEIHKLNNIIQPNNGLSVTIGAINSVYSPIPISLSVNGDVDPEYPLSNLYDYDDSTYTVVHNKCSNSIFTYTYNDETCIDVNQFYLYYNHDMSISYSPESIVIEANNNNGAQWDELSSMDNISMDTRDYKDLYLNKCYSSYRMRITKCGIDPDISESESESMTILNVLHYYYVDSGCVGNEWSASRYDKYSYKICPEGYTSNAKRLCKDNGLQEIEGDETCIKKNPSELYFEETNIIIKNNNFYEQYYTIDSVGIVITSSPTLPEGIIIDSVTQRIYGTPTIPSLKTTYTLSYTNDEGITVSLNQISITVSGLSCSADNNWQETNLESTASLPCPQGYTGNQYRYCNNKGEWEEPNTSECIFSSTPCTGTTYYNGNECVECINGYVTSLNGNNYLCTPCNENEVVINNKCVINDATCPASTIDSYLYPETDILKNAAVNCTNDNQYGYYKVFCDYISEPTWSNDIQKDLCYPRPVSIPGKALESLDYSMQLMTTIDDIYSLLESLARTFVNTFKYQLTDLLLTTDYITGDDSITSLLLHVYYGSNRDFYSTDSSSKRQLFMNSITNYQNTPFSSSSSLLNSHATLYADKEYCLYSDDHYKDIELNNYSLYMVERDKKIYYLTYFCKQVQLSYVIVPIRTVKMPDGNIKALAFAFDGFTQKMIQPDIFISIYRSILISSKVPLSQLNNVGVDSSVYEFEGVTMLVFILNIPNEVLVESATFSSYFDEDVLKNQLKKIIPFSYTSVEILYQEIKYNTMISSNSISTYIY
ncbi:hypothetical protein WA158_006476 [Blastocystis sp. Blastoise]